MPAHLHPSVRSPRASAVNEKVPPGPHQVPGQLKQFVLSTIVLRQPSGHAVEVEAFSAVSNRIEEKAIRTIDKINVRFITLSPVVSGPV